MVSLTVEQLRFLKEFFGAIFPAESALLASLRNYEHLAHRFGEQ
jgi:hypothetical protein